MQSFIQSGSLLFQGLTLRQRIYGRIITLLAMREVDVFRDVPGDVPVSCDESPF